MSDQNYHSAISQIVKRLIDHNRSNSLVDLSKIIRDVSSKFKLNTRPRLLDIIANVPKKYQELIHKIRAKPIRTASGVSIIAVMCKPHRCPHIYHTGNICIYCPGGPDSSFEYSTQSYTGYEPTSMRAIRSRYDPFLQSKNRLLQLKSLGHNIDKIEFIIMGGTFLSLSKCYKEDFIKNLHDSLSGNKSCNLRESLEYSEQSKIKCIGITIETRPDYCFKPHISEMLVYGCTRVEIGVQSIFEFIAKETNRGHTVKSVKYSFSLCKDSGYKVVTHMMPNLPGIRKDIDLLQFKEFFRCPYFRPDGLKIYPTLVIKDTGLYELWKNRLYKSYSPDELVDLLARILMMVPPWTRVYRVQRDIPMPLVSSGVEYGNIRELAMQKIKDYSGSCRDIRSREVGIKRITQSVKVDDKNVLLIRRDYMANNGWETFLSFESVKDDVLIGMLRLRKASCDTFREELKNCDKMYDSDLKIRKRSANIQNQGHSGDPNTQVNSSYMKNIAQIHGTTGHIAEKYINSVQYTNLMRNSGAEHQFLTKNFLQTKLYGKPEESFSSRDKDFSINNQISEQEQHTFVEQKRKSCQPLENEYAPDQKANYNSCLCSNETLNYEEICDQIQNISLDEKQKISSHTSSNTCSHKEANGNRPNGNNDKICHNWRNLIGNEPLIDITQHIAHEEIKNENASIIRELHVYGDALSVSKTDDNFYQHKGYGKKLIEFAENISINEHRSKKISIISGIGTRNYYKKFGYELDGVYMSKFLC